MSAFEDLHLGRAAASALERAGWDATLPLVRDSAATVARGNNLVYLAPPSPAWAAPVVAGVVSRLASGGRALLLAPREALEEWSALVARFTSDGELTWHAARGEARALRLLRADQLQLLLLTPESALALVRRSALKLESITTIMLVWPERLADDALSHLMTDLPADVQRIIVTSRSDMADDVGERYARKAMVAGPLVSTSPTAASGPIRAAAAPWGSRALAVAQIIELLDPEHPVVFAADRGDEATLRAVVPEAVAPLVTDPPSSASLIIAWDAPTPEQFARLRDVAEVVMIVPPGTERWPGKLGSLVRPLRLPGFVDDAGTHAASRRAEIQQALEERSLESEALLLAPLFERFDATQVAAALYALWESRLVRPSGGERPTASEPATARVWVSLGQRDNATPADLVAVLVKELGVDRGWIGKIELRDSFSLVELPAAEAPRIAERLTGVMIRRRKVTARLDRGAERPRRPVGRGSRGP